MKTALFAYSPFLSILGGGEKYFTAVLASLKDQFPVSLLLNPYDGEHIVDQLQRRFHTDLAGVETLRLHSSEQAAIAKMVPPDALFFQATNGVPVSVKCARQILHQQIVMPQLNDTKVKQLSLNVTSQAANREIREKFSAQRHIFFPSEFVRKKMIETWDIPSANTSVVYPPVDDVFFTPTSVREPRILSVGRFIPIKQQATQIELFKDIRATLPTGARLVLIGSDKTPLMNQLIRQANSDSIEVRYGLSQRELSVEYATASVFWSTTGHTTGDKQQSKPESFGLAIAEAMAAGCVPVAVAGGGVAEIIDSGRNGYLVTDMAEMAIKTRLLLNDEQQLTMMTKRARIRVREFSIDRFKGRIAAIFNERW